jgi:hypothetical protein
MNDKAIVTERSRQKHDKNVWEWSHVLGEGMDFQAKEWSFLFRNGLIEHIGCLSTKNLRSRTFYTSERKYAYSISEKRVVCRHIDKPIEIHNSECSKTRKFPLKMSMNILFVTERSRQKHDKNVWEWSHVLGEGMDFQAKEWSFLFYNNSYKPITNTRPAL